MNTFIGRGYGSSRQQQSVCYFTAGQKIIQTKERNDERARKHIGWSRSAVIAGNVQKFLHFSSPFFCCCPLFALAVIALSCRRRCYSLSAQIVVVRRVVSCSSDLVRTSTNDRLNADTRTRFGIGQTFARLMMTFMLVAMWWYRFTLSVVFVSGFYSIDAVTKTIFKRKRNTFSFSFFSPSKEKPFIFGFSHFHVEFLCRFTRRIRHTVFCFSSETCVRTHFNWSAQIQ